MMADWAALEQRVAELEHVTGQASSGLDALLVKIGLIHQDLQAFREETRATLGRIRGSDRCTEVLTNTPVVSPATDL